jgi:hypothetical protein
MQVGLYFTALDVVFGASAWQPGTEISLTERLADATIIAGLDFPVVEFGDVNGDGADDILIGLPTYYGEPAPPSWFTGNVNIYLGSTALHGQISQPDVVISGLPVPQPLHPIFQTTLGDHLGESMTVSDVNGDGLPDLLIGAPGITSNAHGKVLYMSRAYLIIGSPEIKSGATIETARSQQDATISFDAKTSSFGRRVASGDFNGDGIGDLLVAYEGTAYVYFSGPLRAPEITSAKYRANANELAITGKDITGAARVEINGVVIDRSVAFDAEQGKLIVQGTPAELNLRAGKNQVVVLRQGARSNAIKIKVK